MRTLHFLLTNCTYGGCMEDEMDRRTLSTFLEMVCPSGLLEHECSLDEVGSVTLEMCLPCAVIFRLILTNV